MIAADTSTLVSYLQNHEGPDTEIFEHCLHQKKLVLPPVVLTETLCNPGLDSEQSQWIKDIVLLEMEEGFWERAADTRKKLLLKRLKAKIADALIAQSCIDHDVPLLTRDEDFRHYARYCGLKLAI